MLYTRKEHFLLFYFYIQIPEDGRFAITRSIWASVEHNFLVVLASPLGGDDHFSVKSLQVVDGPLFRLRS